MNGILGLIFVMVPLRIYEYAKVAPPNHIGYVEFPAALLIIFALMFARIARDPIANRGLMIYGVLLKVAYIGVAGGHWLAGGIPGMWKPFVFIDLAMLVLMIWAWMLVHRIYVETKVEPRASTHDACKNESQFNHPS